MDKDRSKGAGKKIIGRIKEGFGKLTGDKRQEREGRGENTEGKVQNTAGKAKDKLRGKS